MIDLSTPTAAREAWVEALRSGEYVQGLGALNDAGRFCCLGVAGDLCVKAGLAEWKDFGESGRGLDIGDGYISGARLPTRLLDVFGLTRTEQGDLIELNDGKRLSFNRIADVIEADRIAVSNDPYLKPEEREYVTQIR